MSEMPATPLPPAAPPVTPPRRSRPWLTVLLCILIFLAGSVAGAGAMAVHATRRFREAVRHPEVIPERIVARLRRPLDLDPQQALQIQAILVRRQASLLEARAEALQRARPDFEGIEADIAAMLRPEQVDIWHKLYRKFLDDWVPERLQGFPVERGPEPKKLRDFRDQR
jgi:hypothetical protein